MKYKNMTNAAFELYGVKFGPGDTKEVPGYINVSGFVTVSEEQVDAKPAEPAPKAQTKTEKGGTVTNG